MSIFVPSYRHTRLGNPLALNLPHITVRAYTSCYCLYEPVFQYLRHAASQAGFEGAQRGTHRCSISEALIRETADALVASGLHAVGYNYLNLDDCWQVRTTTRLRVHLKR